MSEVYIVMGTTGEYSDRSEWAVAAYTSEEAAQEHVRRAEEWLEQNYNPEDRYARNPSVYEWLETSPNPYDPRMSIDYTGTHWFIYGPIPLDSVDRSPQGEDREAG